MAMFLIPSWKAVQPGAIFAWIAAMSPRANAASDHLNTEQSEGQMSAGVGYGSE